MKFAGFHASVVWQLPHSDVVGMWFGPLPGAFAPSWQELQVPITCAWSTRVAGLQPETEWHASQVAVVARCVAVLPVAFTPSWQLEHLSTMPVWSHFAGFQADGVWQAAQSSLLTM
ncbi:MAG: hypothetical protein FIB04_04765 [Gammaproteobacteria bacterium]|nr:hypothetical protein [Gammaproteobacteria bacterium]